MLEEYNLIGKIIPVSYVSYVPQGASENIPLNEQNVTEKAQILNEKVIKNALDSQKKWREKVARVKRHKEKLADAPNHIRTDKGLAERKIEEKRIGKLQKKLAFDREKVDEREDDMSTKRAEIKDATNENMQEKRIQIKNKNEEYAERLQEMKDAEIKPEEVRVDKKIEKEAIEARSEEIANKKKDAILAKTEERAEERHQIIEEQREKLQENVSKVDIIEDEALNRADAKNSLLKEAEQFRSERKNNNDQLAQKRKTKAEKLMELSLAHFERLRQRMKDLVKDAKDKDIEADDILTDIVEKGREQRKKTLLASGNPTGQFQALSNIEFFDIQRKRINEILKAAEDNRETFVNTKEKINEKGKENRDANLLVSGNPKQLYKELKSLDFFLWRKDKELFKIIENAAERHVSLGTILQDPTLKHKEVYKILRRVMGFLWDAEIIADKQSYDIIAISRRNPVHITTSLVKSISKKLDRIVSSYILFNAADDYLRNKLNNKEETLKHLLEKENFKAVVNSFVTSKKDYAESILNQSGKKREILMISSNLVSPIITEVPETTKSIQSDYKKISNICTETSIEKDYYNTLETEVTSTLNGEINREEEKEEEKKEETKIQEARNRQNRINRLQHQNYLMRIKYLKEQIEEANLTAHEKVNNERYLIDLFF